MNKRPNIGDKTTVRGVSCTIVRIHPMGTVDVVSDCGKYAWRISGLGGF